MLAASTPDFGGEFAALSFRGFVNHPATGIVRAAPVLQRGLDVMGQSPRAWVELPRAPAASSPGRRDPEGRVTRLAEPAEISRSVVRLIGVPMIYHQEPRGAAKLTPSRARGDATLSTIPRGAIGDGATRLAPFRATRGPR